jgi:protein SCO1/2
LKDAIVNTSLTRRQVLLALGAGSFAAAFAAPLPGDSIYQLGATLQDQEGRSFELASLQGSPVLASMFYTSCDMVCPMIFETIHATLRALKPDEQARLRILMVSFDPARDTVPVLQQTAQARGCGPQWLLARADEATTRKIAAVLRIQYRKLSNGEFNHSTVIAALDGRGRIGARSAKLGGADPALLAAVRGMHAG